MAYRTKYLFRWESTNGNTYRIEIQKDGYRGQTIQRALGQAPVLRRERSGHIWGSSLTLYAECKTDQEFAELYTGSPTEWLTILSREDSGATTEIWRGFVSPELYSEPDIAPPYDVQIIATDGLGELKFVDASEALADLQNPDIGRVLEEVLEYSGLYLPVVTVGYMSTTVLGTVPPRVSPFNDVCDFSLLEGGTAYDILEQILTITGSVIFRHSGSWWLVRESDLNNDELAEDETTGERYIDPAAITPTPEEGVREVFPLLSSLGESGWWPVGQLTTTVKPAKKRVTVTHEYTYREALNPDPTFDRLAEGDVRWTLTGSAAAYQAGEDAGVLLNALTEASTVASGHLAQSLSVPDTSQSFGLQLIIKGAALVTDEHNRETDITHYSAKGFATIKNTSGGTTRWLAQGTREGIEGFIYQWVDSEAILDLGRYAGRHQNDRSELTEIVINIPYVTSGSLDIEITSGNRFGAVVFIGEARLIEADGASQHAGARAIVKLNNGARDEDQEIAVSYDSGNALVRFRREDAITGPSTRNITRWRTKAFDTSRLVEFLAIDEAVRVALPRLESTGVVNIPAGAIPPLGFMKRGNGCLLQEWEWDLYEDELTIVLDTLPAVGIDPQSFTTELVEE